MRRESWNFYPVLMASYYFFDLINIFRGITFKIINFSHFLYMYMCMHTISLNQKIRGGNGQFKMFRSLFLRGNKYFNFKMHNTIF